MKRAVITGIGAVTPLGANVNASWQALLSNKTSTTFDAALGFVVAKAPVDLQGVSKAQDVGFIKHALLASDEALADAEGGSTSASNPTRMGVAVGTGIGSSTVEVRRAHEVLLSKRGARGLTPFFVPRMLPNLAAGNVSMRHGLQGPNHAVSTACATGAHAIGDAARFVAWGDADVMVAGATEACIDEIALQGFARMRALSTTFTAEPERASRPFDADRDGFVMGEGAGVVIVEELEHALARGAKIYCEVAGYGLSGDAANLTAPAQDGRGAIAAMRAALRGTDPPDVGYVNAHATSTPLGDAIENRAIEEVMGVRPDDMVVSSTKGAVGHLLGAAGAVEAIFTILALRDGVAPPTANLDALDASFRQNYAQGGPAAFDAPCALTNSFGFGGTNASLLFRKI